MSSTIHSRLDELQDLDGSAGVAWFGRPATTAGLVGEATDIERFLTS